MDIKEQVERLRGRLPFKSKNGVVIIDIELSETSSDVIITFDTGQQQTLPTFLLAQLLE